MSWVFGTLAVTLGIVFLWGFVAPRSQWRALAGWSVTDTYLHEPGGAAYALRRLFAGLALLGILVVCMITFGPAFASKPAMPSPTPIQQMWGAPEPRLVDRMANPSSVAPITLAAQPILGYQPFVDEVPLYLLKLRPFTLLGDRETPGYVGYDAELGTSAIGAAQLIVNVRGPVLCIPREIVAIETESSIQLGVFYGVPDAADGSIPDHLASCSADDPLTGSVLVPVQLSQPVGERSVQALDGTALREVPLRD